MFTFNSTHKKLLAEKNELKREYDKLKKENDEQKARLKFYESNFRGGYQGLGHFRGNESKARRSCMDVEHCKVLLENISKGQVDFNFLFSNDQQLEAELSEENTKLGFLHYNPYRAPDDPTARYFFFVNHRDFCPGYKATAEEIDPKTGNVLGRKEQIIKGAELLEFGFGDNGKTLIRINLTFDYKFELY